MKYLSLAVKNALRNMRRSFLRITRLALSLCQRLLTKLNKEFNKTIVMVTHDPHAAEFASKIRQLDKGELLPECA